LTSLSFAHPGVGFEQRTPLSMTGDELAAAHQRLVAAGRPAFLLSTCLRVEVAFEGGPDRIRDLLTVLYGEHSPQTNGTVRHDRQAFAHLSRIAAGLESPSIGEPEVLAQFRGSVTVHRDSAPADTWLARAMEAALAVGRATRRHLQPPRAGSIASVAARAAASESPVAILGAGAMARATIRDLDPAQVRVFSRGPAEIAGQTTLPWHDAAEALRTYPALISTVPGGADLLPDRVVEESLAARNRPMLLVDVGMPSGFARHRHRPMVRFLGIDDLASSVDATPQPEIDDMIEEAAATSWARLNSSERARSVITAVVGQAEQAVDEEVRRFVGRLTGAEDPEPVLQQLAHTVARRLLHAPVSFLGTNVGDDDAIELLAEAFGVDGA
jgi:glutamyl-tRNA reductase